jgi:succinyl-CoA synthetase beta subunit
MKIHEYQAKEILKKEGITVPNGGVAFSPDEVEAVAREVCKDKGCVVKAQIHAGGRGKGGGIRIAGTPSEARRHAEDLIGKPLITPQTGPEGKIVHRVLVEEQVNIARELYMGIIVDRSQNSPVIMASPEGGMEIEEVAARMPEKIFREYVDPFHGLQAFQAKRLFYSMGLEKGLANPMTSFIMSLYNTFIKNDCSLAEVNPLVITDDGRVIALDAKIDLDDNASFRHPEWKEMRDISEENPLEVEASKYRLNYIKLDGTIGCMVNGAGLAMSTMDIIKHYGGEPANFLDVGGGATSEAVANAFRILISDPKVKAVLINIFGGILRCDVLAQGVVEAVNRVEVKVPVIIRMEGTNVEEGKEILRRSGLNFHVANTMEEAARKAVALGGD